MKNILKYALIIAAVSFAGAVFAQTAPAQVDGMKVATSIKDGVVSIKIEGECKSKLVSVDDELKALLKQALNSVGVKSNLARAIESAFAAIKSHISNPNESAFGPVNFTLEVTPDDDSGTIVVKGDVLVAREHFVANMKSVFNDDNTVTTTGNVQKISANGKTESLPSVVKLDANGVMTTTGGATTTTESTVAAQQVANLVNPDTVSNPAVSGNDSTIIPDNTIVTSEAK